MPVEAPLHALPQLFSSGQFAASEQHLEDGLLFEQRAGWIKTILSVRILVHIGFLQR